MRSSLFGIIWMIVLDEGVIGQEEEETSGWVYVKPYRESLDVEYMLSTQMSSWQNALLQCKYRNSSLMCESDSEELSNLHSALGSIANKMDGIWLGSRRCGQPEEECLSYDFIDMNPIINNYCLESYIDSKPFHFICKRFVPVQRSPYCSKVWKAGVEWPSTPEGKWRTMECPEGATGSMMWFCDGRTGEWVPGSPSVEDCVTSGLDWEDFMKSVSTSNLTDSSRKLVDLSRRSKFSGDIEKALTSIGKIIVRADNLPFEESSTHFPASCEDIVTVADALIENKEPWVLINEYTRFNKMDDLFSTLEDSGFSLLKFTNQSRYTIQRRNVVVEVLKNQPEYSITFPSTAVSNNISARISLPPLIFDTEDGNQVVFTWYDGVGPMLPTESHGFRRRTLNSPVVGAKIPSSAELDLKDEPVQILFEHRIKSAFNPICVFWSNSGTWSSVGCSLVATNKTHTRCSCNHLTNFAILMDIKCVSCELDEKHMIGLRIITITGCTVSSVFLVLGIFILSYFRTLWNIKNTIHKNLCIVLLFGNVLIVTGLDRTETKIGCAIVAGLLQYFFLSAFAWMMIEAFHIQLLLTKVFQPKHNYTKRYYALGYGAPAIIVITTVIMRHQDYGTSQYCWLSKENGTIWSFVGPVIAVLFYNTFTLGTALWISHRCCSKTADDQIHLAKVWVRRSLVLIPVLGVTWSVGFLYLDKELLLWAYVFASLNSLQGLGIFVFHIAMREEVKQLLSRWIRNRRLSQSSAKRIHSRSDTSS